MTCWKNVLVYADGRPESSFAISEALRFAEHVGGKVTALDVLHYLPARIPTGLLALQEAELLGLMLEQRHRTDSHANRWTAQDASVASLPNNTAIRVKRIPMCQRCANGKGFSLATDVIWQV